MAVVEALGNETDFRVLEVARALENEMRTSHPYTDISQVDIDQLFPVGPHVVPASERLARLAPEDQPATHDELLFTAFVLTAPATEPAEGVDHRGAVTKVAKMARGLQAGVQLRLGDGVQPDSHTPRSDSEAYVARGLAQAYQRVRPHVVLDESRRILGQGEAVVLQQGIKQAGLTYSPARRLRVAAHSISESLELTRDTLGEVTEDELADYEASLTDMAHYAALLKNYAGALGEFSRDRLLTPQLDTLETKLAENMNDDRPVGSRRHEGSYPHSSEMSRALDPVVMYLRVLSAAGLTSDHTDEIAAHLAIYGDTLVAAGFKHLRTRQGALREIQREVTHLANQAVVAKDAALTSLAHDTAVALDAAVQRRQYELAGKVLGVGLIGAVVYQAIRRSHE